MLRGHRRRNGHRRRCLERLEEAGQCRRLVSTSDHHRIICECLYQGRVARGVRHVRNVPLSLTFRGIDFTIVIPILDRGADSVCSGRMWWAFVWLRYWVSWFETPLACQQLTLTSTISGIIAMTAFRQQFSTGYIDPSDGKLNITPAQASQIVSILSAGTFFGALFAAPIGDRLGRRISLIISVAIFVFGVVLQTCAMQLPLLMAGRYVPGVSLRELS